MVISMSFFELDNEFHSLIFKHKSIEKIYGKIFVSSQLTMTDLGL